nr:hypothetical protein B0A51_15064 [Rachicladosporium sp. CCFEE 5018]
MLFLPVLALATSAVALTRNPAHVNKRHLLEAAKPRTNLNTRQAPPSYNGTNTTYIVPQNANTTKFAVNGSALPDVDFDVGESYAGLMPIGGSNSSEMYFWFVPSANELAGDEIVIWLNGGPGCSSLEGFLQENGPVLWQYGTYKPVRNNWAWSNLTNMVWVEQPAGTGFGKRVGPKPTNEIEVAAEFMGFWKNFVDTFSLQGRKVYITGESYAGYYVPYIADAFHNATDTEYYGIDSIMFYDPSVSYDVVTNDIPAVPFVDAHTDLFNFNQTFMDDIHTRWETCGYKAFYEEALTYPPTGKLPTPPNVNGDEVGCNIWNDIYYAAPLINPCWDVYQVATTCPLLWDVLGFPGSFDYLPPGAEVYFNRTDVQTAINAPIQPWEECTSGVFARGGDKSPPSGVSVLGRVVEQNQRTIIGHALLDFILLSEGTEIMIQNLTWNGAQGFSCRQDNSFYVPYHGENDLGSLGGAGNFGRWHEERGLTFVTVELSGHMVPQYAPTAAYRQLEYLLGRISSLSEVSDFTTQTGDYGNGFNFTTTNVTMSMSEKF